MRLSTSRRNCGFLVLARDGLRVSHSRLADNAAEKQPVASSSPRKASLLRNWDSEITAEAPHYGSESHSPPPVEAPPLDFIARVRDELTDTLARVREAVALPWKDLTAATLAELRFNSIAGWLPPGEASALRAAFQSEMNRLYLIAERDGAENASQTV